jgi:hypothetical protein
MYVYMYLFVYILCMYCLFGFIAYLSVSNHRNWTTEISANTSDFCYKTDLIQLWKLIVLSIGDCQFVSDAVTYINLYRDYIYNVLQLI